MSSKCLFSPSIADFVEELSMKYHDMDALVFRTEFRTLRLSYGELYTYAGKTLRYFEQQKIQKGDKIIIWFYDSPEWVVLFLACIMAGVIVVPLDFGSDASFVERIQEKVGVKKVFASRFKEGDSSKKVVVEDLFATIRSLRPLKKRMKISSDDVLEIIYTSGTTSSPKGVVLTHENIISNIHSLKHVIRPRKSDVFMSIVPLSHMLGQVLGFFVPMRFGCPVVYSITRKSRVLLSVIKDERVSVMVGVPAFLQIFKNKIERKVGRLLGLPHFFQRFFAGWRLRLFIVGGAPLDSLIENFWNKLGVLVLQGYGLTETSPIVSCNTERDNRAGTVGKVLPDQEIRILSDGEIVCRGKNVFSGYFQNKNESRKVIKNGWFHTGDLGNVDKDGFLKIVGRKKNMILTDAGLNVYPEDIEKVVNRFSEIEDSCVLGMFIGEKIIITVVVTLRGKRPSNLLDKINSELSSHQKIQKLIVWGDKDFPRTSSFKIKRREVENGLKGDMGSEGGKDMDMSDVDKLYSIIAGLLGVCVSKINEKSNLYRDLGVDSLRRVELISLLEEEYGVEIQEDQITFKSTVASLRGLIKGAQNISGIIEFSFWSFSWVVAPFRYVFQKILFMFLRCFYPVKVVGERNLDVIDGPVIFVSNHTSHLDTPTLLRALPYRLRKRGSFAAAEDYFFEMEKVKIFFLRLLFNIYPFSRENRVKNSFRLTGKILDRGFSVCLYPEGTRTITGKMGVFSTGVGLLAVKMGVPIVPVKVGGLFEIMPKDKKWLCRGKAVVKFGKMFYADAGKSYIEIAQEIENIVNKL